ncbi:hypothetical protein KBB96_05750 [Luteolibacter ambystomatis]|uniref:Uncharacterized protein n=1 Tax=Luteolibacter ambystomatis TaxID=2824561 RepID=A0A975J1N2_9BACT|nr:hypothetical protein [Luteolibacter ambystomatis]QUE52393.1 hypothetical protein KBB96_05750 [Luteolibacter ambystomatis]
MERLRKFRLLKAAIVGILLFQFALMVMMSGSARLHHDLHCDAGHPDHQCEVTLFTSGTLDDVPPPAVIPAPVMAAHLPEVLPPVCRVAVIPGHLIGGILAQAPPRAP